MHYAAPMKDLWARLDAVAKSSKLTLGLRNGATEKEIAATEKKMKLKFPTDFRESLLLHDGQEGDQDELFPWMPGCSPLKPLLSIVERWQEELELVDEDDAGGDAEDARLQAGLYNKARIPIAGTEYWDGDNSYIDLAPGSEGTCGQLIGFSSECDIEVLGTSFRDALRSYVEALESGAWRYDAEMKDAVPRDEESPGNLAYEFAEYVKKL